MPALPGLVVPLEGTGGWATGVGGGCSWKPGCPGTWEHGEIAEHGTGAPYESGSLTAKWDVELGC